MLYFANRYGILAPLREPVYERLAVSMLYYNGSLPLVLSAHHIHA
jgi:hypothetical protein